MVFKLSADGSRVQEFVNGALELDDVKYIQVDLEVRICRLSCLDVDCQAADGCRHHLPVYASSLSFTYRRAWCATKKDASR